MLNITDSCGLRRAVDFTARSNAPQLPLMTWAQGGAGVVIFIGSATVPLSNAALKRCRKRPTVIIVGADQGQDCDPLPVSWACLPRLVPWAERASILLHAAGGEPEHYRWACREAERRGKVVIVECTPRTLAAWADTLPKGAVLAIVPHDGKHPVAPAVQH